MLKSLDDFKFRLETIADSRIICTLASEKFMYNVVIILAPLFLIGCSSFLKITRTTIKSLMSLKFGMIRPWTGELPGLECLKKSYLRTIQRSLLFGLLV